MAATTLAKTTKSHPRASLRDCEAMEIKRRFYLLVTEPNGEFRARDHLSAKGYEAYVPAETVRRNRAIRTIFGTQHRSYALEVPIFRGYLLLKLDYNFGGIYGTPGLRAKPFLQVAGKLATMSEAEVELLRKIEHAIANPEAPVLPFKVGDRVRIVEGPFMDKVGVIQRLDNEARIGILLNGLGKAFLGAHQIVAEP